MAAPRVSSPFDALKYEKPKGKPGPLARAYVEQVAKIPEVEEVWGFVDGTTLHLDTIMDENRPAEKRVHDAERLAADAWPGIRVDFRVRGERPDYHWLPENAVSLYRRPA